MPSVVRIQGQELRVHENRDEVMRRIVAANAEPVSHGGLQIAPLGCLRLTDMASDEDLLAQASSIGYVREG